MEEQKKRIKFSRRQKEILIGTILGDAHLETQDAGRTYRLKIEHSIKQREYVDWLYAELRDAVTTVPRARERLSSWNADRVYVLYGFNTLSVGPLRFYAKAFYANGKKIIPKMVARWLTPLALAVWFMDDGSIKSRSHRTVCFNTQGFDDQSVARLQSALLERYGIHTSLRRQGNGSQIYLLASTVDCFFEAIMPHVLPSMKYKVPKIWVTHCLKSNGGVHKGRLGADGNRADSAMG